MVRAMLMEYGERKRLPDASRASSRYRSIPKALQDSTATFSAGPGSGEGVDTAAEESASEPRTASVLFIPVLLVRDADAGPTDGFVTPA